MKILTSPYAALYAAIFATIAFLLLGVYAGPGWLVAAAVCALLVAVGVGDLVQTSHAVRRNYPIIGNLRYFFEMIRPAVRQYFFESDYDEEPFSRVDRSLVYQRAKQEIDKRPFGTLRDVYQKDFEWINHSMEPVQPHTCDFRVKVGGPDCSQPYNLSVLNISAMSFGALSANAVLALNKGAALGNFAHDTGEGGISRYHLAYSGDLIWNIGTGYFGCNDGQGN
ncbi:MAG: glutamate synthase-related protein, partial [Spongiibacteraceae bacterium]|nr:glutamate synthase-related protein [Spongiibacteraceae bacterium]